MKRLPIRVNSEHMPLSQGEQRLGVTHSKICDTKFGINGNIAVYFYKAVSQSLNEQCDN